MATLVNVDDFRFLVCSGVKDCCSSSPSSVVKLHEHFQLLAQLPSCKATVRWGQ